MALVHHIKSEQWEKFWQNFFLYIKPPQRQTLKNRNTDFFCTTGNRFWRQNQLFLFFALKISFLNRVDHPDRHSESCLAKNKTSRSTGWTVMLYISCKSSEEKRVVSFFMTTTAAKGKRPLVSREATVSLKIRLPRPDSLRSLAWRKKSGRENCLEHLLFFTFLLGQQHFSFSEFIFVTANSWSQPLFLCRLSALFSHLRPSFFREKSWLFCRKPPLHFVKKDEPLPDICFRERDGLFPAQTTRELHIFFPECDGPFFHFCKALFKDQQLATGRGWEGGPLISRSRGPRKSGSPRRGAR